jgi:DNA-binding NarL/FixJ family response regulator
MELTCLIVDDQESFLTAARELLTRQGLQVVGVAMTSAEAQEMTRILVPDVVLVDINLGTESGFDLAAELGDVEPRPAVILVSTHSESEFADLIEQAPVAGFLPKSALSARAVRELIAG